MEQRALTVLALTLATTATLAVPDFAAAKCLRVEVCHVPPGGSGVFHTLKVCDHVLPTHLAHGDVAGNCATLAEELCDDGDACTVDTFVDPSASTLRCADVREATDCDDENECTSDSCESATGCVNNALTGAMCDDGQICTGPDTCSDAGLCEGAPIAGCCTSDANCSPSLCANESCDLSLNACVADPVICISPDLCAVAACDEFTGACVFTERVCPDGQFCDPTDGSCILFPEKTVFVTSGTFNGNLGGLAGADAICQAEADAAGIGGPRRYMAWLGHDTGTPHTRFAKSPGPYVRPDGVRVADSYAALTTCGTPSCLYVLQAPISIDPHGVEHDGDAWTNVLPTGLLAHPGPIGSCDGWTSTSASSCAVTDVALRMCGASGFISRYNSDDWTLWDNPRCEEEARLYCFEQ